jgi:hypothetical protein
MPTIDNYARGTVTLDDGNEITFEVPAVYDNAVLD